MYTGKSVGVDCTVVCLEGVPDGVSDALEVFWSILEFPEFLGFRKVLRSEVWESRDTPERHREYRKDTGNMGNNRGSPYNEHPDVVEAHKKFQTHMKDYER